MITTRDGLSAAPAYGASSATAARQTANASNTILGRGTARPLSCCNFFTTGSFLPDISPPSQWTAPARRAPARSVRPPGDDDLRGRNEGTDRPWLCGSCSRFDDFE